MNRIFSNEVKIQKTHYFWQTVWQNVDTTNEKTGSEETHPAQYPGWMDKICSLNETTSVSPESLFLQNQY